MRGGEKIIRTNLDWKTYQGHYSEGENCRKKHSSLHSLVFHRVVLQLSLNRKYMYLH